MKNKSNLSFILFLSILFIACGNEEAEQEEVEAVEETISVSQTNPLDSLHPENISKDLSWFVNLNIQEGFLISYSITRQDGKEFEVNLENENPAIGGVDHPEPHFINDTTYFVPHVGGSPNGHFELYIYENGTHKFKEISQKQ